MTSEKSCFGIGCNQHTLCARYHAVETHPEMPRMDSCESGDKFVVLCGPGQIDDDAQRQVQWGQG